MSELRTPYKGTPPRPWFSVVLVAPDGSTRGLEVVADTGNPCALIVGTQAMQDFQRSVAPGLATNFGHLTGCWLRVQIPELDFDETILAFGSDDVVRAVEGSHPDFNGLAGLPLLQKMEFGGDRDTFYLRA